MSYIIKTEVDINAAKAAVWDVLVDFPRYGEWSNFSLVEGTAQVGNRLSIKMPGFSFRPTVTVVEPGEQLQWSGTLVFEWLFLGRHSF
ncbi:MAG: SRPBCC family protein, partial [Myxococcales bacterium]|nr:SRPBCC family protein [Myxococcales bacterium]